MPGTPRPVLGEPENADTYSRLWLSRARPAGNGAFRWVRVPFGAILVSRPWLIAFGAPPKSSLTYFVPSLATTTPGTDVKPPHDCTIAPVDGSTSYTRASP